MIDWAITRLYQWLAARERRRIFSRRVDALYDGSFCQRPPQGWYCTRQVGHFGPCAAVQR